MGRVRVTARGAAYLLVALGVVLAAAGVYLLAGLGWALIAAGVGAAAGGLLVVDVKG